MEQARMLQTFLFVWAVFVALTVAQKRPGRTSILSRPVLRAPPCPNFSGYDAMYDFQAGSSFNNNEAIQEIVPPRGRGCSTRGVLKIILNNSGPLNSRALIDLFFTNPTDWTFNLGGSPTNNGYGGDASSTQHDAEIHPVGSAAPDGSRTLRGYRSDIGLAATGSHQAFNYGQFFRTRLTMIVGDGTIVFLPDNHNNFNYYDKIGMFNTTANNQLYLGMNKVISGWTRLGQGLCKVGIKLLDEL